MIGKKDQTQGLDSRTANQMLDNIFDSCDMESASVPFETIQSFHNYRSERFVFQRTLLVIMMVIALLLPLLIIGPSFELKNITEDMKPAYEIDVAGHLPIKKVIASIDGKAVPIRQTDDRVFVAEPPINGRMHVIVTLFNNQSATDSVLISQVDTDNPYIISHEAGDGFVDIKVGDKNSGVDFDSIYCLDEVGNKTTPVSYDKESGTVRLQYPKAGKTLNIFVPDFADNMLQVVITTD